MSVATSSNWAFLLTDAFSTDDMVFMWSGVAMQGHTHSSQFTVEQGKYQETTVEYPLTGEV